MLAHNEQMQNSSLNAAEAKTIISEWKLRDVVNGLLEYALYLASVGESITASAAGFTDTSNLILRESWRGKTSIIYNYLQLFSATFGENINLCVFSAWKSQLMGDFDRSFWRPHVT